jgi:TRAP-type uncharacterized transport system substrate-binding protein
LPGLGLLLILAASAWLAWNALQVGPSGYALRITGGKKSGTKHEFARKLADHAGRFAVRLTVVEGAGSIESLDEVDAGRAEVALVQGGIDSKPWGRVRQVAALQFEPLHLVVRGPLHAEVVRDLGALKGRSINLGQRGSGSEALALRVLAFAGFRPNEPGQPGDFEPRRLSHEELMAIRPPQTLPDAAFTVGSLPAPDVRTLIQEHGYRLVPLPFCEAFAGHVMADRVDRAEPDKPEALAKRGPGVVDPVHLRETIIPPSSYGLHPSEPAAPLPTIGARVLLVANVEVPDEAVKRLLQAVYETEFAEIARPPLDPSMLEIPSEFPRHPGSIRFQQRNRPLIVGDDLEVLEKTLSLVFAVIGALFVAWQWALRRYRRKRELGFEAYLLKVTAVEQAALGLELASKLELAPLLELQANLGRLKSEALARFTQGELEGEGLMSGFLTHANDARDYLARLILHARSVVEKQARKQGLSPDAAWDLAIGGHDRAEHDIPSS